MNSSSKVAVVTGAGTGIGRAAALALLKDGYRVVLAGRRPEPLAEVVVLGHNPENCLVVPTDVSDPDSVKALFDAAVSCFGRVDVLLTARFLHPVCALPRVVTTTVTPRNAGEQ